jgi:hypothetical protein
MFSAPGDGGGSGMERWFILKREGGQAPEPRQSSIISQNSGHCWLKLVPSYQKIPANVEKTC